MEDKGNQGREDSRGELERWIRYKKECAVEFVLEGYSVEWQSDATNWLCVYKPGCPVEERPEFRAHAKFYMEPSRYGIDNGRISKLLLQQIRPTLPEILGGKGSQPVWTLYNYDRGLDVDILDESPPARELYETVLSVLN